MVDIFKSAIDAAFGAGATARIANNFSTSPAPGAAGVRNEFTGQIVDVGNIRLRVGNQIAEGKSARRGRTRCKSLALPLSRWLRTGFYRL